MQPLLQGFYHTPPLWLNQQFGLQQFNFPRTALEAVPPIALPTNLRLGHQMEYVFAHLLKTSGVYEVVAQNILIEEGKIRIGELDFILRHKTSNQFLHIELAYKLYIVNPEISAPIYRLMGPNRRDMLYTKLDKLKQKQLPLLHHPSLAPLWDTYGITPTTIPQQCCFKGQLFMPFGEKTVIRPLNTACIAGQWIRFDEFNSKTFSHAQFYIPTKLEWVVTPHHQVGWMSHLDCLLELNLWMIKENAPMLWVQWPNGVIEKIFVVWW